MIKGTTKNVLIAPLAASDVEASESFVPHQLALFNGHVSPLGHWRRRPGYRQFARPADLAAITALIPDGIGYVVTRDGHFFRYDREAGGVLAGLGGARLEGNQRPTWANYDGTLLLANGGAIIALPTATSVAAPLGGNPPAAKFLVVMDTYVILAGFTHDDISFAWSSVNTKDRYPSENFNQVAAQGEQIRMVKRLRHVLHFFLSKSIELWVNVGGLNPFSRQVTIERGTAAGHSVVQAADTFFWLGDDLDFYTLNGNQAQVISGDNRARVASLTHPEEVYGFDFRNEHLIRWFAPADGRCFVWDYQRNLFSEDYAWRDDSPQLLPIGAYMERGGKSYVGSSEVGGYLSEWSQAIGDDDGGPIRLERRFRVALSADGTTSRVNRLRLRVQRGKGPTDTTPRLLLRWAFDEEDWQPYEEIDLGVEGDACPYVDVDHLGIGSELRIELIETDAVDALVTAAMLTIEGLGR